MVTNDRVNLQNYMDAILNTEMFKEFSCDRLKQLFDHFNHKIAQYNKGQIIHMENEICKSMDMVLDGKLSIQKIDRSGNVLKVTEFIGSDILGANLLFADHNAYPMTVVAELDSVVLHIYKQLILDLSCTSTSFTTALLKTVSNKTLILTDKIDTLSFKTIREQISDFLVYQRYIQKSNTIRLNITKKELAKRFGVQRTSLSRELNKMRRDGLIEFDSKTITIKNTNLLQHYIL